MEGIGKCRGMASAETRAYITKYPENRDGAYKKRCLRMQEMP